MGIIQSDKQKDRLQLVVKSMIELSENKTTRSTQLYSAAKLAINSQQRINAYNKFSCQRKRFNRCFYYHGDIIINYISMLLLTRICNQQCVIIITSLEIQVCINQQLSTLYLCAIAFIVNPHKEPSFLRGLPYQLR